MLATEIFKPKNSLNSAQIEDVFKFKNLTYNFRNVETPNQGRLNKKEIQLNFR